MNHLFQKTAFLYFIFIFFALILNVFIISLLDNIAVANSFFTIYIFWLLMILMLFLISRKLSKIEIKDDDNV